jgi:hypothetical protein
MAPSCAQYVNHGQFLEIGTVEESKAEQMLPADERRGLEAAKVKAFHFSLTLTAEARPQRNWKVSQTSGLGTHLATHIPSCHNIY